MEANAIYAPHDITSAEDEAHALYVYQQAGLCVKGITDKACQAPLTP